MVYPALLLLMRTPRLPVVDWTDDPGDLNGLVRFAERRNLVSARVPSHFKRSLPTAWAPQLVCHNLWPCKESSQIPVVCVCHSHYTDRAIPASKRLLLSHAYFTASSIWRLHLLCIIYEGWNFNSGNYLFTTDTK